MTNLSIEDYEIFQKQFNKNQFKEKTYSRAFLEFFNLENTNLYYEKNELKAKEFINKHYTFISG